jgi:carboxymethylenebutenolidase
VPENVIPTLRAALDKAGTKYAMDIFPGTSHGFCFPTRADYHTQAAETVWTKLFDLWGRNLR